MIDKEKIKTKILEYKEEIKHLETLLKKKEVPIKKELTLIEREFSYSVICKELKEEELNSIIYPNKKVLAFHQIMQIERFFCQGWIKDFNNNSQYKYYPYFYGGGGGLVFRSSSCDSSGSGAEVAYYPTREISHFVGKTFQQIYINFIKG